MSGGHWTEQDFIHHVYGIGPADGHLDGCGECRARWEAIRTQREFVLEEPEVSHELLARQRREIYGRLGRQPSRTALRVAPAFAAVLLLLLGFFFTRPAPVPVAATPAAAVSDTQLFSEIYALEQSSEPRAVTPMRALFEEN